MYKRQTQYSDLTVYPTGVALPLASNLNWSPGATVANRVIVPVGTSGQISIYNGQGGTDVVVDVDGYFTDGSSTPAKACLLYTSSAVRRITEEAARDGLAELAVAMAAELR